MRGWGRCLAGLWTWNRRGRLSHKKNRLFCDNSSRSLGIRLTALQGTDPNLSPSEKTSPHPPVDYWCAWRYSNPKSHRLTTFLPDELSPIEVFHGEKLVSMPCKTVNQIFSERNWLSHKCEPERWVNFSNQKAKWASRGNYLSIRSTREPQATFHVSTHVRPLNKSCFASRTSYFSNLPIPSCSCFFPITRTRLLYSFCYVWFFWVKWWNIFVNNLCVLIGGKSLLSCWYKYSQLKTKKNQLNHISCVFPLRFLTSLSTEQNKTKKIFYIYCIFLKSTINYFSRFFVSENIMFKEKCF